MRGRRQLAGQRLHAGLESRELDVRPLRLQALQRADLVRRKPATDRLEQCSFLHPAAGKGVERQDLAHKPVRGKLRAPTLTLGFFLGMRARRSDLIQQHEHRLVEPAQDLRFGGQITGIAWRFRGVHEIEDHIGGRACGAYRLLAAPEGPVTVPIPDLAQQPADRIVGGAQALHQARGVAKARGVPQAQFITFRRAQQNVDLRHLRDMRGVAHFTDLLAEQRSRERRLADVRVRDQCEVDPGGLERGVAHGLPPSAGARSRSAVAISGVARSTHADGRPCDSTNARHALQRSPRRAAAPACAPRR